MQAGHGKGATRVYLIVGEGKRKSTGRGNVIPHGQPGIKETFCQRWIQCHKGLGHLVPMIIILIAKFMPWAGELELYLLS